MAVWAEVVTLGLPLLWRGIKGILARRAKRKEAARLAKAEKLKNAALAKTAADKAAAGAAAGERLANAAYRK